jgi:hypothetical protein
VAGHVALRRNVPPRKEASWMMEVGGLIIISMLTIWRSEDDMNGAKMGGVN